MKSSTSIFCYFISLSLIYQMNLTYLFTYHIATSYFRGNRYVLNNDKSTMVLYDSKGDFAGIQFGVSA